MGRPNKTGIDWNDKKARNANHSIWAKTRLLIIRQQINDLLGNQCTRCYLDDLKVLDIDHINGGGKQERKIRGGSLNYYTKILQSIQSGSQEYRLLCRNCNWIAHKHPKSF